MRIVVRQGTGIDLADLLMQDIRRSVEVLNKLEEPTNSAIQWKN